MSDIVQRFRPGARRSATASAPTGLDDLHRRRDELAERVAGLTWDLGGLTYEMAIRDHFRLDVLVRRAAVLQEADAELGEVERLLASAEEGITGQCRSCGAVHSRGATFCWKCGQPLMLQSTEVVPPAPSGNGVAHRHEDTVVIDGGA